VVVIAAVVIWMGIGFWRSDRSLSSSGAGPTQVTLDPSLFTGDVRDAYQSARQHPDVLVQLHCYCGCDRELGHRNLLDCFRGRHAAQCEICLGEANMAATMADKGQSIDEMINAIRARYARGG
jgi:hypothetical protein